MSEASTVGLIIPPTPAEPNWPVSSLLLKLSVWQQVYRANTPLSAWPTDAMTAKT